MRNLSMHFSPFFTVILIVLSLIIINPVVANPISTAPTNDNAVITIQSPQNGATYNVTSLPLYFTVQNNEQNFLVRYILNSQSPVTVPIWVINQTTMEGRFTDINYTYSYPRFTAVSNTVLGNISNGEYKVTVENYYDVSAGKQVTSSTSITFTIDTAAQSSDPIFELPLAPYPKLTFGSFSDTKNVALNNKPYAQIGFSFGLNAIPSWVGYNIDGEKNETISDNKIIFDMHASIKVPLGSHSVTLYANDTSGNWAIPVTFNSTVISFEDYVAGKSSSNLLVPPSVSPSPNVPELSWLVILPLLLTLPFVALKLFRKDK